MSVAHAFGLSRLLLDGLATSWRAPRALSSCPNCGANEFIDSAAWFWERKRIAASTERPFRCANCRLRIWRLHTPAPEPPVEWVEIREEHDVDLTALDAALSASPPHDDRPCY